MFENQALRRSELATPVTNERLFANAAAEEDRGKVVRALNGDDRGGTARAVRGNDIRTEWAYGDIIKVTTGARENLDTLVLPKAPAHVKVAEHVLTQHAAGQGDHD